MQSHSQILLPTAYFPPLSYMMLVLHFDQVLIESKETYPKQSFRNRSVVLTANGLQNLTVPVKKPFGNRTQTGDIVIENKENWYRKHQKTLNAAYSAAPFFQHYMDMFLPILESKHDSLLGLNMEILALLLQIFRCQTRINLTDEFIKNCPESFDARNLIHPKSIQNHFTFKPYFQVFNDRFSFQPDLSILDLLFNEGPQSGQYLRDLFIANQDKLS